MRAVCLFFVIASLAAPQLAANDFLDFLLGHRELEVIAVTDTTPAGRALPAAVVTAYDLAEMEKNPTLSLPHLWITRIACPSLGFSLPDALPSMLALAGPNLGRETPRPVRTVMPRRERPTVKFGELQVVEFLKELPPTPAPASKR